MKTNPTKRSRQLNRVPLRKHPPGPAIRLRQNPPRINLTIISSRNPACLARSRPAARRPNPAAMARKTRPTTRKRKKNLTGLCPPNPPRLSAIGPIRLVDRSQRHHPQQNPLPLTIKTLTKKPTAKNPTRLCPPSLLRPSAADLIRLVVRSHPRRSAQNPPLTTKSPKLRTRKLNPIRLCPPSLLRLSAADLTRSVVARNHLRRSAQSQSANLNQNKNPLTTKKPTTQTTRILSPRTLNLPGPLH